LLALARSRAPEAAHAAVEADTPLLKADALHQAMLRNASFYSIATDTAGMIQAFNAGAERMFGYTAAELANKVALADLCDPGEVAALAARLTAETGSPVPAGFGALAYQAARGIDNIDELTYLRKDGSRFPAVVSVTALRDTRGAMMGFLLVGTDNTARKLIEAEQDLLNAKLRDQQFYTRSLIESNTDALMATDAFGFITDVNHRMELLTGYSRDELIGTPFKNYFTDPGRAEAAITLVLAEDNVSNYLLTARGRDGQQTVVSYNGTTFHDRDGRLQGVFAAARDVTERAVFEHALQETNTALTLAKAAAEKANLAKSEFLSSMSHELRTPLNAVLGFAQLMASERPPPTPSQQKSIDQILHGGWYLLQLINEILDLATIESGKVTMSQEAVLLSDVLADCEAMIAPQAAKRGIAMRFPAADALFYVHADRTRLKQVMINLLANAVKYNRDGGIVVVECAKHGEQRVRISVRDTGAGLTPEQLGQLFQPFNRLGQSGGAEEGNGIGLVVTRQLVELMGGLIEVASEVDTGSVFTVELDASAAPELAFDAGSAQDVASVDAAPTNAPCRTLLYVEDNPANLVLVEQLIARRNDLKLLTAIDAPLGISLARTFQPDLILMDINLPGMSGIEALGVLRHDPLTAAIPVLALSANAVPRDIEKGLEAGFFRYLTKPIKVREFMEALDVALEHAAAGATAESPQKEFHA
jgi:PAS domain S-box-containing protein